jgi:hypothetical protein
MTTEITIWEQPEFEGTSLIPSVGQVTALANPCRLVGRENVDTDDLIVPSISLLQGMSDAVTSGLPGARPGLFQHSNTGEILEPPLKCIVIHYHKSNAFFPQEDKYPELAGKEPCISRDAVTGNVHGDCEECGLCLNWMDDGRPPAGAQSHVFTVLTDEGPAVIRFGRTSFKAGKKFLSQWSFSSKNLWAHPVLIAVASDTKELMGGKKATFYKMDMKWLRGEEVPSDWQDACLEMHKRISGAHEEGKFGDEAESDVDNFD